MELNDEVVQQIFMELDNNLETGDRPFFVL
jgi:hypothetical protein